MPHIDRLLNILKMQHRFESGEGLFPIYYNPAYQHDPTKQKGRDMWVTTHDDDDSIEIIKDIYGITTKNGNGR